MNPSQDLCNRAGIEQFRDPGELRLDRMLTQPLRDDDRAYPLGRREPAS
jgi:hypothetical protein